MFILVFIVSVIIFLVVRPITGFVNAWVWACTFFGLSMLGIFTTNMIQAINGIT